MTNESTSVTESLQTIRSCASARPGPYPTVRSELNSAPLVESCQTVARTALSRSLPVLRSLGLMLARRS
jgi:hypothetical protein